MIGFEFGDVDSGEAFGGDEVQDGESGLCIWSGVVLGGAGEVE